MTASRPTARRRGSSLTAPERTTLQTCGSAAALEFRFGPNYIERYLEVRDEQFRGRRLLSRWNSYWVLEAPEDLWPDHRVPTWSETGAFTGMAEARRQLDRARRRWLIENDQITDAERAAILGHDLVALRRAGIDTDEALDLHDLLTNPPKKSRRRRAPKKGTP